MKNFARHIPNILSVIRILLIPVTVMLILKGTMTPALIVFLIACFTDLADGHIARKYNFISRTGMWLDPLADKLMAVSVLVTFAVRDIIPLFVVITIFAKELLMIIGGMIVVSKKRNAPANKFGKFASFLLNTAIGTGFFYLKWSPWYLYGVYVALAFAVFAFVQYAVKNWKLMFAPVTDEERAACSEENTEDNKENTEE